MPQHDGVEQQHHEVEQVEEGQERPHHAGRRRPHDLQVGAVTNLGLSPAPIIRQRLCDRVDHSARQDHAHRQQPHARADPTGGAVLGEAGEEARRQQLGTAALAGRALVLHQGGKAAERHPGQDEDGHVDVDVKDRADKVQNQLTQEAIQRPLGAQCIVGSHYGRDERQQQVADAEVGHAEVDWVGGGRGDAVDEDPQGQCVAQQSDGREDGVDAGQDVGGDDGKAEAGRGRGRGRGRGPGCVGIHQITAALPTGSVSGAIGSETPAAVI